jgi:hypothetical protein
LDETNGNWAAVEGDLPANAAPTQPEHKFFFEALSCASAGNCSAVGIYCAVGNCDTTGNLPGGSTGEEGLLLTESAGTWEAGLEAALPANAATTSPVEFLRSISCPSAGNCSAVGTYRDASLHTQALLMTQSAGSWSTGVRGLLPSNATDGSVSSVSCPAAGSCTAAGHYSLGNGNSGPLLLTKTDGKWARGMTVVMPGNATSFDQHSSATVSCASIHDCTAVGSYATAWAQQGLLVNGPSPTSLVPDVVGKSLAAAKRSIRSQGCSVGRIRHHKSRSVKSGRVISQTPKPGSAVKPGTKVGLTVSSG